jgi:peptidoglycan/LPS O-acetylase OafA/YrhL
VARLALWVVPVALLLRVSLVAFGSSVLAPYVLMPARMDGLAIGAAIAVLIRDDAWCAAVRPIIRRATAIPARWWLALLVAVCVGVSMLTPNSDPYGLGIQTFGFTALALIGGVTLAATVLGRDDASLRRWLSKPLLVNVGKYSYALYLIHVPVNVAMRRVWFDPTGPLNVTLFTIVAAAVTYALARLSWTLVESPALALKRHAPYAERAPVSAQAGLTEPASL